MPLVDYRTEGSLYAESYSRLNLTGTLFLAFRDVPGLIKQHVSGVTTLDYGSGAAESSLFLKALNLDVEGVDIKEEMIKCAKNRDPSGKYKLIESAKIPVDDNHYDLVFSSYALIEVDNKEELLGIMKEIHRVLKKNGTFITIVRNADFYNADWLSVNTEFEENKNLHSGALIKTHFKETDLTLYAYFWSDEDYRELMNTAGLTIVQTHNPLGQDEDGYDWGREKTKSPCTIYVAKKITDAANT